MEDASRPIGALKALAGTRHEVESTRATAARLWFVLVLQPGAALFPVSSKIQLYTSYAIFTSISLTSQ